MRQIKFKGNRTDTGKTVVGNLIKKDSRFYIVKDFGVSDSDTSVKRITRSKIYKVIPETVCQFTGLLDKNGNEIYEGDIIDTQYGNAHILFDKCRGFGGYSNKNAADGSLLYLSGIDLEHGIIIGNIHDNPEFLEKGEHTNGKNILPSQ